MIKLSKEQCYAAIRDGEFGPDVRSAAPKVAIVLTQSWCSQWIHLRPRLEALPPAADRAIFWVEYDLEAWFDDFRSFKEDVFANREVPYLRYYRDGKLVAQSNFVDQAGFLSRLEGRP